MVVLSKPVAAIALFISSVIAIPFAAPDSLESRQTAGSFYAITGVKVGGVQPRLEIRELQKLPEQWNLYILALTRFMAMDQKQRESFYQVSGIHGEPYLPWDGVKTVAGAEPNTGYCTHGSNLFGPWHRPYLNLFEQIVSNIAGQIVNEFPNGATKDKYRDAQSRLRQPYWDWASKSSPVVPTSVSTPTVGVTYPNGTKATISNPLYSYKFHPLNSSEILDPYSMWTETKRQPNTFDASAVSQPAVVESNMAEEAPSLRTTLFNLLSTYQSYNDFSSFGGAGFGSIEGIHGTVHVLIGGSGHMSSVPVAGFDPIFMLHHTNVDRQLALFQYIYKDTYIQPAINGPTYTIVSGSTQDENSPLTPFHSNAQGSFITSKMARFTDNWGYTYPEILGNPSNATVRAKVTSLYGPSTTSLKKRAEEDSARAYLAEVDIPVTGEQYTVRVAVGGEHVGSHSTLARQSVHDTGMTNTGSVDLNAILKKKHDAGDLKGLDVDAITAYLKENLSYTVKKAGSEVSKDIEGLKVSVISTQVVPPTSSSDFPKWVGGFEEHDDVKSE